MLKKLEEKRQAVDIGSGLEAMVILSTGDAKWKALLDEKKDDLRYLFIVSQVVVNDSADTVIASSEATKQSVNGGPAELPVAISVEKAKGEQCQRCCNYSELVGKDNVHPTLCERCVKAVI